MASQHASHDQGGYAFGGYTSGGGGWADPLPGILRDMVNERAVGILLECILVVMFFDS